MKKMIKKELRDKLEEIDCTLKCGGKFQYVSDNKKGDVKMVCPKCKEKGLTNEIVLQVKPA